MGEGILIISSLPMRASTCEPVWTPKRDFGNVNMVRFGQDDNARTQNEQLAFEFVYYSTRSILSNFIHKNL
jgi:hypothetical protein